MDYSQIQSYFMDNLEVDRQLFNEYHALLVRLAKTICKKDPSCNICPLKELNKLIRYQCDSCGKILPGLQQSYILKIELYAYPKVIITKEDLKKNTKREMAKLLRQLKDKDTKELEEEVYASYKLSLCKKCRDIFLVRVKNREFV
jgi:adenine-specific DNA glycosylase